MDSIKNILGITAIALAFISYIPYIKDILNSKTFPHTYSWLVGTIVSFIAFALQISNGGGTGALVTFTSGMIALTILILSIRQGRNDITTSDKVFLTLALLAIIFWLVSDQPTISIILTSCIAMLGFIPTVRKTWSKPTSETLSTYLINTLRFALSIVALQSYTFITVLYPATWFVANGLFSMMLILRRKKIVAPL